MSVTSEQDALAELALFERDPRGYQAKFDAERTPEPEAERIMVGCERAFS